MGPWAQSLGEGLRIDDRPHDRGDRAQDRVGARLGEVDLSSAAERRQVLEDWAGAPSAYAMDLRAHERIAEQCRRTPDAVAVSQGDERLSYGELERRSNQLAHRLGGLGVGPDVLVGLLLDRSLDQIVAMLGVLKAGGAYVPLDARDPAQRLAFMLQDVRPGALLVHGDLPAELPELGVPMLRMEALDLAAWPDTPPDGRVDPQSLAYVIYTSGSTGRPKGVMVRHAGLDNLVAAQIEVLGLGPADRVLQFSRASFDAAVFDIFAPLCAGATLCLPLIQGQLGEDLAGLIDTSGVTVATLPVSAAATLEAEACPGLRLLVVAGEACPPALARRWAGRMRFINAYGPTEGTVWSSYAVLDAEALSAPIGRPTPNVRLMVLDSRLEP
jgi:amino acid adenylation domain-containing protein